MLLVQSALRLGCLVGVLLKSEQGPRREVVETIIRKLVIAVVHAMG